MHCAKDKKGDFMKVYHDEGKGLTVNDISENKTIEQINEEFNGNFVDVTDEVLQDRKDKRDQAAIKTDEQLTEEKIVERMNKNSRDQAVGELVAEEEIEEKDGKYKIKKQV